MITDPRIKLIIYCILLHNSINYSFESRKQTIWCRHSFSIIFYDIWNRLKYKLNLNNYLYGISKYFSIKKIIYTQNDNVTISIIVSKTAVATFSGDILFQGQGEQMERIINLPLIAMEWLIANFIIVIFVYIYCNLLRKTMMIAHLIS